MLVGDILKTNQKIGQVFSVVSKAPSNILLHAFSVGMT